MPHPKICVFGNSATLNHPLVLVIGRAANTAEPIQNFVGSYDFRNAPRCGFWNASYAALAGGVNLTARQLKARCIDVNASPLIYADSVPFGIPMQTPQPMVIEMLTQALENPVTIRQHLDEVFGHANILSRVRIVLLSGLTTGIYNQLYGGILPLLLERLRRLRIPSVQVPFFYNGNAAPIRAALADAPLTWESTRQFLAH